MTGDKAREVLVRIGGMRLDRFLAEQVGGLSRGCFKDLILRGCVSVGGVPRRPDHRLRAGELIRIDWPQSEWAQLSIDDWLIHEDKDLLVFNKPAGLIMHPMGASWETSPEAAVLDSEANLAGLLLSQRPEIARSGVERCGLVHRLDRHTSGVLVAAKTSTAQQVLLTAFRERTAQKTYRAIVLGEMDPVCVNAPVGRISGMRRVQVTQWGRDAETFFKRVGKGRGVSLVSAEPKTGRTHQIRAHLAMVKHPVLGDAEWCGALERRCLTELGLPEPPRMMLHAWRLKIPHPRTGKCVVFTAPLPKDFRDYWKLVKK
ncbi:MAG: RluA family pseudouridine synthase [Elusimicrobiota bacterium]|jgi:23S rRNA pseudouridine1911/1915/1917 synthase